MEKSRIMVIEDSPDDVLLIERTLKKAKIHAELHRLETEKEVRRALLSDALGCGDRRLFPHHRAARSRSLCRPPT